MSVLVLFLILALTYTLVASKARSVGKTLAHLEKSGDPPNYLLDECAMLLFRGTNDPHCPFATWSLLEGIYGNVSFRGTITATQGATSQGQAQVAGGQFLTIGSTATNLNATPGNTANYFKGCVLTMLTGNCVGQSSRIVASQSGQVTVMRFQSDAGLLDPSVNDTFTGQRPPLLRHGPRFRSDGQLVEHNAGPGERLSRSEQLVVRIIAKHDDVSAKHNNEKRHHGYVQ